MFEQGGWSVERTGFYDDSELWFLVLVLGGAT